MHTVYERDETAGSSVLLVLYKYWTNVYLKSEMECPRSPSKSLDASSHFCELSNIIMAAVLLVLYEINTGLMYT